VIESCSLLHHSLKLRNAEPPEGGLQRENPRLTLSESEAQAYSC